MALVFPQPYSVGISTLGWQVIYRMLAGQNAFTVERYFWDPKTQAPLSRDSGRALQEFPLIGFSLNFELDCLALVQTLEGAGIPSRATDNPDWPLVLAGGPLTFLNPAPIAPAVDAFFVGEAEAGFLDVCNRIHQAWVSGKDKQACLDEIANLPGVYAPGRSDLPVKRQVAASIGSILAGPASSCFISSQAQFSDALLLEINRGCPYGCRFCAAGFVYRPPRQADVEELKAIVEDAAPPKVGLVGTALTDWPDLLPFLTWLQDRKIKFSLSSLRADGLTEELLEFLRRTGTRTLTLALEGASRRLRRAMNKRLKEKDLLLAVERISRLRFNHLKLYCIVGWPDETEEDLAELGDFLKQIQDADTRGRGAKKAGIGHITMSVSCLVPKPWTPLQWAPMASEERLKQTLDRVRKLVKPIPGMRAEGETPFPARLQGLLARGDQSLFDLLQITAREKGNWRRGLKKWAGDPAFFLDREREEHEPFPWECIDTGIRRDLLWQEWQNYQSGKLSPGCSPLGCSKCAGCGMETEAD